jgi:hypothetical protein
VGSRPSFIDDLARGISGDPSGAASPADNDTALLAA